MCVSFSRFFPTFLSFLLSFHGTRYSLTKPHQMNTFFVSPEWLKALKTQDMRKQINNRKIQISNIPQSAQILHFVWSVFFKINFMLESREGRSSVITSPSELYLSNFWTDTKSHFQQDCSRRETDIFVAFTLFRYP